LLFPGHKSPPFDRLTRRTGNRDGTGNRSAASTDGDRRSLVPRSRYLDPLEKHKMGSAAEGVKPPNKGFGTMAAGAIANRAKAR
jgi:hypothetical protein